jgi:hypothetical protein
MLDPFFLNEVQKFRSQTKDERIARSHPSVIPALWNVHFAGSQIWTSQNDTYSDDTVDGMAASLLQLHEHDPFLNTYTGVYRTYDFLNRTAKNIIYLKKENNLTGSQAGEGMYETGNYYETSANNDAYGPQFCLTFAFKNTSDQEVVIPANSMYVSLSGRSAGRPARVTLTQPDAVNGQVTAVTHTQLYNSGSNTYANETGVPAITVPAGQSFLLHLQGNGYEFYHSTAPDYVHYANIALVRNLINFLTAGNAASYVARSYETVIDADEQLLMNLHSRKYTNWVDNFNGVSDIQGAKDL